MPQAFLESGVRVRSLRLGCPHHPAGEPLFNDAGCPQCGQSDYLRRDYAWNGEKVKCKWCGLGGMEPHFAGIENMDAYFAGWEDEHGRGE